MSTIDKISQLLKEQNKKQKDLTDYLGISKNAFTDWKSGRIKSYVKHIPEIAIFFGVTTDYLLDRKEKATPEEEQQKTNTIKILGRDGSCVERELTDDQIDLMKKMIEQMPDANDL